MKPKYFDVGVYYDSQRSDTVTFKKRWQQRVFHWLLNKSVFHNGSTEEH